MPKKKRYVVRHGKTPGIYTDRPSCQSQISGFAGAQYKSFPSQAEAEWAWSRSYDEAIAPDARRQFVATDTGDLPRNPQSIAVDAACSGNPGVMEYQGVNVATGEQLFHAGPWPQSTVNVGEFLALVHGLTWCQAHPAVASVIYTDSRTAMAWIRAGICKTQATLQPELAEIVGRAEQRLRDNASSHSIDIIKRKTDEWGEIPADFGRK